MKGIGRKWPGHFMMEEIDLEDFKAIKSECTEALKSLEAKLGDMPNKAEGLKTIEGLLDIVIEKFSNIQLNYKSPNIIEKRKLIGSIYPKMYVLMESDIEPLI
ncbi:hypothetical protein [Mucilaginibacter sp.]